MYCEGMHVIFFWGGGVPSFYIQKMQNRLDYSRLKRTFSSNFVDNRTTIGERVVDSIGTVTGVLLFPVGGSVCVMSLRV